MVYSIVIQKTQKGQKEKANMDITVTNPKTNQPQTFEIRIREISSVLTGEFTGAYSDSEHSIPNLCKLTDQLEKVKNATFHDLDFHPLTEEGATLTRGQRYNKHYRGGKEYHSHNSTTPDANPFVIRKQVIDTTVTGHGNGWKNETPKVYFTADTYNKGLTDGQKETLATWFSDQLVQGVNTLVLAEVKKQAKDSLLAYAKKDIPLIRGWLDMLEAFEG